VSPLLFSPPRQQAFFVEQVFVCRREGQLILVTEPATVPPAREMAAGSS